jgi:hypothetical protein
MTKHEPCPPYLMEKHYPEYTICEVLRKIYRATANPHIEILCRIAVTMAKKMDKKLQDYNKDWCDDFWDKSS